MLPSCIPYHRPLLGDSAHRINDGLNSPSDDDRDDDDVDDDVIHDDALASDFLNAD